MNFFMLILLGAFPLEKTPGMGFQPIPLYCEGYEPNLIPFPLSQVSLLFIGKPYLILSLLFQIWSFFKETYSCLKKGVASYF